MSTILVSGFTFVKNGLSLGYPIKESIESIEPLCDEIVINVGFDSADLKNDDGTYQYLRDTFTHPKFNFVRTYWNPAKKQNGEILSEQTNVALAKCRGRVCQYIQADEVIHERDLPIIHDSLIEMDKNPSIEGLVYNYLHFYGNVNIIKKTRSIYRYEVRSIKNNLHIRSWKDAQGFRHQDGRKLNCIHTNGRIFHYGWARKENIMKNKVEVMDKFYHGDQFKGKDFQYERIWGLRPFEETHPQNMQEWINKNRNDLDIMNLKLRHEFKNIGLFFSDTVEALTGYRIGEYKNFKNL